MRFGAGEGPRLPLHQLGQSLGSGWLAIGQRRKSLVHARVAGFCDHKPDLTHLDVALLKQRRNRLVDGIHERLGKTEVTGFESCLSMLLSPVLVRDLTGTVAKLLRNSDDQSSLTPAEKGPEVFEFIKQRIV